MNSWTCEFCGWENYQNDRGGLREPECTRCGEPRDSKGKQIDSLRIEIKALSKDDKYLSGQLEHIRDVIGSLENEISDLRSEYNDIFDERRKNLKHLLKQRAELNRLENLVPGVRVIYSDQRRLIEEVENDN